MYDAGKILAGLLVFGEYEVLDVLGVIDQIANRIKRAVCPHCETIPQICDTDDKFEIIEGIVVRLA